MKAWHLEKYEDEVRRQGRYAQIAWGDLQQSVTSQDDDRAWYSVQSFLVAAANISKLLWPPKSRDASKQLDRELRADALRGRFAMNNSNIIKTRELRDHLEHF